MTLKNEFQILHLKGDYCPEDFALASCSTSTTENKIPSQSARRIPQTLNASQPNFRPTKENPLWGLKNQKEVDHGRA
jgi:hypothetical protein